MPYTNRTCSFPALTAPLVVNCRCTAPYWAAPGACAPTVQPQWPPYTCLHTSWLVLEPMRLEEQVPVVLVELWQSWCPAGEDGGSWRPLRHWP